MAALLLHPPAGRDIDLHPLMTLRIVARPSVQRIELYGELDASTVHLVTDAIRYVADTDAERVEVCLSGLSFIAARGLSELLAARERLTARGKRFTVTAVSPITLRLLRLTGTAEVFGLDDDAQPDSPSQSPGVPEQSAPPAQEAVA
ncbi:MAG TPA: STAS domain-containing protein [Cryptosporangiaceae bacterium]|nr:STAS domain-containing protein [Cryptosporangiaceae bacterium]